MIDNLKSPKYKVKTPNVCSFPNIPKIQCQKTEAHPPSMIDHLKSPKYNVKIPNVCSFPNPQNTMSKDSSPPPSMIDHLKSPKYNVKIPNVCSFPNPQNTMSKDSSPPPPSMIDHLKSPKYNVKIPNFCSFPNPQNTMSKDSNTPPPFEEKFLSPIYFWDRSLTPNVLNVIKYSEFCSLQFAILSCNLPYVTILDIYGIFRPCPFWALRQCW